LQELKFKKEKFLGQKKPPYIKKLIDKKIDVRGKIFLIVFF